LRVVAQKISIDISLHCFFFNTWEEIINWWYCFRKEEKLILFVLNIIPLPKVWHFKICPSVAYSWTRHCRYWSWPLQQYYCCYLIGAERVYNNIMLIYALLTNYTRWYNIILATAHIIWILVTWQSITTTLQDCKSIIYIPIYSWYVSICGGLILSNDVHNEILSWLSN